MMPSTPKVEERLYSAEEFAGIAAGYSRCELEEGRLIEMTPAGFEHGRVAGRIYEALRAYLRRNELGQVATSEVGMIVARDPDTVRGAEVVFISWTRLPRGRRVKGFLEVPPELVVEVFSPEDRWSEVERKVAEYHAFGVDLVWVADPGTETVRVFPKGADPRVTHGNGHLEAGQVLPGLEIAVASLFAD